MLLKAAEVGLVRLLYSSLGHDAAGRSLPRRGGEDRRGGGTVGWRPRGPAVREAVLRRRRPGRRRRGRL